MRDIDIDMNANEPIRVPNQFDHENDANNPNEGMLADGQEIGEEPDASEDQATVRKFTLLRYKKCLKDMRRLANLPDENLEGNLDKLAIVNELKGIAERLNKVAEEDDNAAVDAVRRGALVLYTEILNIGALNEQTRLDELAANGIAIFSWTCYERTRKERGCVNGELISL